jgi:hypothetical protein
MKVAHIQDKAFNIVYRIWFDPKLTDEEKIAVFQRASDIFRKNMVRRIGEDEFARKSEAAKPIAEAARALAKKRNDGSRRT